MELRAKSKAKLNASGEGRNSQSLSDVKRISTGHQVNTGGDKLQQTPITTGLLSTHSVAMMHDEDDVDRL